MDPKPTMTHGAAALELWEMMQPNSTHPMADAFRRGLPIARAYLDGVYGAIPGGDRPVDLDPDSVTMRTPWPTPGGAR